MSKTLADKESMPVAEYIRYLIKKLSVGVSKTVDEEDQPRAQRLGRIEANLLH